MSDLNNTDAIKRCPILPLGEFRTADPQRREPAGIMETHGKTGRYARQTSAGGETLREAVDCINLRKGVDC